MTFKTLLKCASAAITVMAFALAPASAQVCEITELSAKTGELYLQAQNALVVDNNPAAALAGINKLRALPLNCYEEGAVLGLSAQVKLQQEDYIGAIADLRTSLDKGYIAADNRAAVLKTIYLIYFQENKLSEGLNFAQQWISAGGRPTRDEKWSFAVANNNINNFTAAIPWAEQVFETDGRNADDSVTNFLIFLYDKTNQKAKKAALIERLLERDPTKRIYWDAIAGDYQTAGDDAKAFEIQKAMYLGGILQKEEEIERIVQFYNLLDAPYQAARILEKEMNAGRITKNYTNLELLVNLYQVAREHEKAIPVITEAAKLSTNGAMFERLGRSYADLQKWAESEAALTQALNKGGVKDPGLAWVQIGQSRYERSDRAGAREAFRKANNSGGRGWLAFMDSEEATQKALVVFEAQNILQEIKNEEKVCEKLIVLGNAPESCTTIATRLEEAQSALDAVL